MQTARAAKANGGVRFEGIGDRKAAEELKGIELFVARDALPAPDEDEFYHADLIGLPRMSGRPPARHGQRDPQLRRRRRDRDRAPDGGDMLLPFTRASCRHRRESGRIVVAVPEEAEDDEDWKAGRERQPELERDRPDAVPGDVSRAARRFAARQGAAKNLWSLEVRDIRDHGLGKHRTVDDTPAGGGPGMVMRADVAAAAIDAVAPQAAPRYLSVAARRAADPSAGEGAG